MLSVREGFNNRSHRNFPLNGLWAVTMAPLWFLLSYPIILLSYYSYYPRSYYSNSSFRLRAVTMPPLWPPGLVYAVSSYTCGAPCWRERKKPVCCICFTPVCVFRLLAGDLEPHWLHLLFLHLWCAFLRERDWGHLELKRPQFVSQRIKWQIIQGVCHCHISAQKPRKAFCHFG